MPSYLTPQRYRSLGLGVDLSSKSDAELDALIHGASAMANAFCAAPSGHDFRGGSVSREKHRWDIGNVYANGTQRIWPFHRPIKNVTTLDIQVTNTQYISFSGGNLYINEYDGYVEPIALAVTTAGMFGWSVLPNVGLRTPVALIDYTYGWSFQVTDEELTSYSGQYTALNQFWDEDEPVVIKKNGVVQTEGADYSIDYYEGSVTVSSSTASDRWTATYVHPLPNGIAHATAYITNDLVGQTAIAAAGMLGLSGIKVEEVELRQSSKVNFNVTPINSAAQALLAPYRYVSIA